MFRLEKEMATHSSVLAWTVEPGGLQSTGSQRVRHDRSDIAHKAGLGYTPRVDRLLSSELQEVNPP